MKTTDQNWKDIISSSKRYWFTTRVTISEPNGANPHIYGQDKILLVKTSSELFSGDTPTVGNCVAGEFTLQMLANGVVVPAMAKVFFEVMVSNADMDSDYIPMGVYFVDERSVTENNDGLDVLSLHGYDAMLKAEQDFPDDGVTEKFRAQVLVDIIARQVLETTLDSRTAELMNPDYVFTMPVGYSCREVLSLVASAYCGNFVITESGKLRLLALNQLPPETSYLIDNRGRNITFGGVRILV